MWMKSFCNQPAVAKKKKKNKKIKKNLRFGLLRRRLGLWWSGGVNNGQGSRAGSRYYVTLVRGTDTSTWKSGDLSVSDQSPVRCWVTILQTTSLSLLELPREIEGHVTDCGIATQKLSAYPIFISVA